MGRGKGGSTVGECGFGGQGGVQCPAAVGGLPAQCTRGRQGSASGPLTPAALTFARRVIGRVGAVVELIDGGPALGAGRFSLVP